MSFPTQDDIDGALDASIDRWQANAQATFPGDYRVERDDFPLCQLFLLRRGTCGGCPVAEHTGWEFCFLTPYQFAEEAQLTWEHHGIWRLFGQAWREKRQRARDRAAAMMAFLREIRQHRKEGRP